MQDCVAAVCLSVTRFAVHLVPPSPLSGVPPCWHFYSCVPMEPTRPLCYGRVSLSRDTRCLLLVLYRVFDLPEELRTFVAGQEGERDSNHGRSAVGCVRDAPQCGVQGMVRRGRTLRNCFCWLRRPCPASSARSSFRRAIPAGCLSCPLPANTPVCKRAEGKGAHGAGATWRCVMSWL